MPKTTQQNLNKISENTNKIVLGTWVQRTRLHLSEIHDFLETGKSVLDFENSKLKAYHKSLNIKQNSLEIVIGQLDHIIFTTTDEINCKIYEDGLIILSTPKLKKAKTQLESEIKFIENYYLTKFSKAINYIFSKGAPLPRQLSSFEVIFPYFFVLNNAKANDIKTLFNYFKEEKYYDVSTDSLQVFRGDKVYVLNNKNCSDTIIDKFIEEQIFIREYNNLLHYYLNMHRHLWEEIDALRDIKKIKGSDVQKYKSILDGYSKTSILIDQRINQMPLYLGIRESLVNNDKEFVMKIGILLSNKYSSLKSNHSYISNIWSMTKGYINESKSTIDNLNNKVTNNSIHNLTIITSTGVAGTIIGLFTRNLPTFQITGLYYFAVFFLIGYLAQKIINVVAKHRTYEIESSKLQKLSFKKFNEM